MTRSLPRTDGQTSPKVLVTRPIPEAGLLLLAPHCEVEVWESELPPTREELLARVAGKDGLLTLLTERIDGAVLDAAGPGLKVVSNMAVGYDNIDVEACRQRGIAVGNTPGVLTETTADLAFSLMAAAARRLVEGADYVRAGRWKTWGPMLLLGQDLYGATLGIIGMGRIGQAMARRAAGFSMRVLYLDQNPGPKQEIAGASPSGSLRELLELSDFVSLHVPLTSHTHHMLNRETLCWMKSSAILVNSARGALIDPEALFEALSQGRLAGAALDVTEPEPLPAEHLLLTLPNCLVVPHIGSASTATRGRMSRMAAENLLAGLQGRPLPTPVS